MRWCDRKRLCGREPYEEQQQAGHHRRHHARRDAEVRVAATVQLSRSTVMTVLDARHVAPACPLIPLELEQHGCRRCGQRSTKLPPCQRPRWTTPVGRPPTVNARLQVNQLLRFFFSATVLGFSFSISLRQGARGETGRQSASGRTQGTSKTNIRRSAPQVSGMVSGLTVTRE